MNQPGSEAWSPACVAISRAVCTRSQYCVACHHSKSSSSPFIGRETRTHLNSLGPPLPALVWLSLKTKKRKSSSIEGTMKL